MEAHQENFGENFCTYSGSAEALVDGTGISEAHESEHLILGCPHS